MPFFAFAGISANYSGSDLTVTPLPENGASFLFEGLDPIGEKDFRYGIGTYDANQFFVNSIYSVQWVPQEFLDCIDTLGTGSFFDYQNVCSGLGVTGYNPEYIVDIENNTTWNNGRSYNAFMTSGLIAGVITSTGSILSDNILSIVLIGLGLALLFFVVAIIKRNIKK